MQIDTHCAAYDEVHEDVCRSRDFIKGERRVKSRNETYLPKLTAQETDEYEAYKERTTFLNATARTHTGLHGQVFRKDPKINLPDAMDPFKADADLAGNSLYDYGSRLVSEVIAVGRAVTLVDWSDKLGRPVLVFYAREDVLNWSRAHVAGRTQLVLLVLRECYQPHVEVSPAMVVGSTYGGPDLWRKHEERVRVLTLDAGGVYQAQVWAKQTEGVPATATQPTSSKTTWTLVETTTPKRNGKALTSIPALFHEATEKQDDCAKPPLDDLVSLNLNHYRLSADHVHGLRYSTLPTPYAFGFDPGKELKLGSATAWISDNVQAKVGYLEATGAGLSGLDKKIKDLESSMAVMGARLLETQKREVETAEAMSIRQTGEGSVLSTMVSALSSTLSLALKWAAWWQGVGGEQPSDIKDDQVSIEFNTDFASSKMSGAEVVSFVNAWVARGISRRTLFEVLQAGEVIAPERTYEEETALIDAEQPPGMELDEEEEQETDDDSRS